MKALSTAALLTTLALCAGVSASEPTASVGIVNFMTCITDSKTGKQEQASFEALKKQMSSLVEETEKQLTAISGQLNDKEYLDSLSPEAEEALRGKLGALNDEMGRYQNQYYQVLNQANMKLVQVMQNNINTAAERVAKEKKLGVIINKEACFFYSPALEITSLVVAEMDKTFEKAAAQAPKAETKEEPKKG
jgi:outer membrane protein